MAVLNNRYNIQKILGEGGMGRVYLAQDTNFQDFVAVKECFTKKGDSDTVERIKREFYFMAKIDHPNLIKARDFFCLQNRYFIVMEYVKGTTLADIIKDKSHTIPIINQIQIAQQICHAIAILNNNGIVHRDLKPSNIILTENNVPKILDLGIAKSINRELETLTRTDTLVGTPEYMSPEQFSGTVQQNTDVFSLGVVLYQFFANMDYSPFYGGTMVSTMFKVVNQELPLLNTITANTPESIFVSRILEQALVKDHTKRISSMQEMFLMFNGQKPIEASTVPASPTSTDDALVNHHTTTSSETTNIPSSINSSPTEKRLRPLNPTPVTKIRRQSRYVKQQPKNKEVKINKTILFSIIILNFIVIALFVFVLYGKDEQSTSPTTKENIKNNEKDIISEEEIINLSEQGIVKLLGIYDKVSAFIDKETHSSLQNKLVLTDAMNTLKEKDKKSYQKILEKTIEIQNSPNAQLETISSHEGLLYYLGRKIRNEDGYTAEKVFFLSLKVCFEKIKKNKLIVEDLEDIYFRIGQINENISKEKTELYYRCSLYTAEILYDHLKYHKLDEDKIKDIQKYFEEQKIMDQNLEATIYKLKIYAD